MPKRKKTPFCSLETVFNHHSIHSICQRIDLLASLQPEYEDRGPIHDKLIELAIELQIIITMRAFEHMEHDAAAEFIEHWDDLPTHERLNALLSVYHSKLAASQQGDGQ
jgi:hypothetical protein